MARTERKTMKNLFKEIGEKLTVTHIIIGLILFPVIVIFLPVYLVYELVKFILTTGATQFIELFTKDKTVIEEATPTIEFISKLVAFYCCVITCIYTLNMSQLYSWGIF